LEAAFPRPAFSRLFRNKKVSHSRENSSVSCYLSNYYCSRKLILPSTIWRLTFGQIAVTWVTYKTVPANFNSSFHFKVIGAAFLSPAVAMIFHPEYICLKNETDAHSRNPRHGFLGKRVKK